MRQDMGSVNEIVEIDSDVKYWELLGEEVAKKHIKYQDLTFERYQFTEEDREGYYKDTIEEIERLNYKPLHEKPECLVDYAVNKKTGHQFIRAVLTDKIHKDSVQFMSKKWMEIFLQVQNDNGVPPQFKSVGKVLLEIFVGDCENDYFRGLDDFMKHGSNTYFFRRQMSENGKGYQFQLYMHKIHVPTT